MPATRSVIRSWCRRPALTREEVTATAGTLWARPVFECRLAAVELLDAQAALLRPGDAVMIERMLRTAGTWALVDTLAEHVMGGLVERYPELTATLDRWASDDDFWLRRSAMLALLRPLRRGGGDFDRFSRYADADAGGEGVLHPQGHRLDPARHGQAPARAGRRVAGAAGAPGIGGHDPRGGQAAPARRA